MTRSTVGFVATMLVLACSVAPSPAATQSVTLRPFVGVANLPVDGTPVPIEEGGFTNARFDGTRVFGLEAALGWDGEPFEVRLGLSRTFGGSIQVLDGMTRESCGPSCTKYRTSYASIGAAAISHGTFDILVSPLTGRVSPLAFIGVAYRGVSYGPDSAETAALFENRREVARRWGLGVDVRITDGAAIRVDAAEQASGFWFSGRPDDTPFGRVAVLSVGARFDVLGGARR